MSPIRLAHELAMRGDSLDPWRVAVVATCCLGTDGRSGAAPAFDLLRRFPTPALVVEGGASALLGAIGALPLPRWRARRLVALSEAQLTDALGEHVGGYVSDAVQLVAFGVVVDPEDAALRAFAAWLRGVYDEGEHPVVAAELSRAGVVEGAPIDASVPERDDEEGAAPPRIPSIEERLVALEARVRALEDG